MKLGISEILKNTSELKTKQEKIDYLRQNDSVVLRTIIVSALEPGVKWALPEGAVPYKENQLVDQESTLFAECRKMYLFLEGGHPTITQRKRESIFVQMLETLSPDDAKLIIAAKDKKLPYKGITVALINEAFPNLISVDEKKKKLDEVQLV